MILTDVKVREDNIAHAIDRQSRMVSIVVSNRSLGSRCQVSACIKVTSKHAHLKGWFIPGLIISRAEEMVEPLNEGFLQENISLQGVKHACP